MFSTFTFYRQQTDSRKICDEVGWKALQPISNAFRHYTSLCSAAALMKTQGCKPGWESRPELLFLNKIFKASARSRSSHRAACLEQPSWCCCHSTQIQLFQILPWCPLKSVCESFSLYYYCLLMHMYTSAKLLRLANRPYDLQCQKCSSSKSELGYRYVN